MSVLLVQLGDIHIQHQADRALERAPQIGGAISAEVRADVTCVVLALCGDVAYSGQEDEYHLANAFIEQIEGTIKRRFPTLPIHRVAIPGNHDCSFSGDQTARDVMLTAIKDTERPAESVRDIVLAPLNSYFNFAATSIGHSHAITASNPFYHSVDIHDGHALLRLHLLNTAWMSSLHERQGSLQYPLAEIVSPSARADCSIAILHHPTLWFAQPHAMRPLRDCIGRIASVVLVNHEHVSEATEQVSRLRRDGGTTRTLYVAGGVIQDDDAPEVCTFNILAIDVTNKRLGLSQYSYIPNNGGLPCFLRTAKDDVSLATDGLVAGPSGAALTREMGAYLEDPGAPITHPHRDPRIPIHLRDIFLYPDLWELGAEHDGSDQRQIKSSSVAKEVLATERVLITGGEKSGRTSIVKMLFMDAFDAGKIPILLAGKDLPKRTAQLREHIRSAVEDQYADLLPDAFEQLDPSQRVVLVDDVHRMSPAQDIRHDILDELERTFGTVVLCGDDLIRLDEVNGRAARESRLWEYRHLVILGFGEYLREQFVRKWLMLGGDTAPESTITQDVDRICALLNAVVRKQLLPTYPLFLLVVLQQTDLANASVQGGSFGKLFEGLMTAILNRSRFSRINIGDKYYYLAALAKRMFDDKTMCISSDAAQGWHRRYWDDIEINVSYDGLVADFENLGVLTVENDTIRFKYVYFFCFFVAYYLNRTLHEPTTRALITQLSGQLHHRVSAEIVLFLTHLTGDPIILDEMIKTCDRLFADAMPAALGDDVQPLNRLGEITGTISIPDSPDESRRELRLRSDELVAERIAATRSTQDVVPPIADSEAVRRLFDIHAAYKTIQILGQALRNIAGSAEKARKEEVIGKIIALSRRMLGVYFKFLGQDTLQQVVEDIAGVHKEQHPDLVGSELLNEVCRHLFGMSQYVCFVVIRHTTSSVGSENLAPTIRRYLGEDQSAIAKIFDLSFDLDRHNRFPKEEAIRLYRGLSKNRFCSSLVRILVAHHLYLYVVPVQDRQSVCDKMDIKLLPSVMDRGRKRLVK